MRTRTPEQHHAAYNWLTPAEVAERLRIGVGAVRALIRDGHLRALDISRSDAPRYMISEEAVEAFVRESEKRVEEVWRQAG